MKITFVPEDKDIFKNKIIETKCATRHIEYMDGTIREAEQAGVETLTPMELEALKYAEHHQRK